MTGHQTRRMNIAVGSTNPVKIAAVESALERFHPSIEGLDVDSGVSDQPRSITETVQGAENRAERALESTSAEYGVGLEGGVARFEATPGVYLVMWAAVTDGDRFGRGSGPSIRLPEPVAKRLESGEELGPVMDELLGTTNIAESEGAVGVLTGELTERTSALSQAVACAFGPFVAELYDRTER